MEACSLRHNLVVNDLVVKDKLIHYPKSCDIMKNHVIQILFFSTSLTPSLYHFYPNIRRPNVCVCITMDRTTFGGNRAFLNDLISG